MRVKLKRTIAGLLSVLVAFTMLLSGQTPVPVKAETNVEAGGTEDNAGDSVGTIQVQFGTETVNGNVVTYTVGEQSVTVTVSGGSISNNSVEVPDNDLGSVEFVLGENYDSATMQVKVSASDGFQAQLTVTDNETSLDKHNANGLPAGPLTLVVEAKNSNGGDGANSGGESTAVSISLGGTELLHEGVLTASYESFAGVENGTVKVEAQKERGVPQLTLAGYNGTGQILKIDGNSEVSVVFKQGTTKLGGIQLGEGARVEVDAMDVDILEPARLELSGGICAIDTSKPADSIRFTNNIILAIGTEESRVTNAFSGIKNVHLENYEFHSRDTINTVIYATTAFDEVESIDIYCSKVQVNATKLFARTNDTRTDCIVHSEGQIQFTGEIGNGTLKSNYYSSYPNGAVSRDEMDGSCNIPSCMDTYEITESDMSNGITESNNRGCTLVKNDDGSITLTSTDPILYSVSYQVDDGINVPNPTCGEITMNGFEKGFYTVDGTNGRFEAWIAAGETVNVTILPHKGYQYQKDTLNINGQVILGATAGEARGTYTFEMPANAGHICAGFAAVSDIVSVTNANIDSASIVNTNNAITNGNAKLEIASATVSDEVSTAIASAAGDYTVAETLEVDLSEAVIKNYDPTSQEQSSWDTELHELTSPVTISVNLGTSLRGGTSYEVVRVHNGQSEVLTGVSYHSQTGTLTFPTDKFSIYAIAYSKAEGTTSGGGSTSGSISGSSSSSPSWSGSSGASTPKTETKADGTKVETVTETKADGTKVETSVETKADGTKVETVTETKTDGSQTETKKETTKNKAGKEIQKTVQTQKDKNGQVTGSSEVSVIEKADAKTSVTVNVSKDAKGNVTDATADVNTVGKTSGKQTSGTLSGKVISQIAEAAGDVSVAVTVNVTNSKGKPSYTLTADSDELTAGSKLKVVSIDEKTGAYVLVNAKTYQVSKNGDVKVKLPGGKDYELLTTKEEAAVSKAILATVKVKKSTATIQQGKRMTVQFSNKLNMENVSKITYTSSKKSVAVVNKNGTVTAKDSGKVTIKVNVLLRNGKKKVVKMTVSVP